MDGRPQRERVEKMEGRREGGMGRGGGGGTSTFALSRTRTLALVKRGGPIVHTSHGC